MNPTFKRYLISSITTFLAAFCGSLSLQFQSGMFTSGSFTVSIIFSILAVAGRAGIKAIVESLAGSHADA